MNKVSNLKDHPWSRMTDQERHELKKLGPDTPDIKERQIQLKTKGRKFSKGCYENHKWMTGNIYNLIIKYNLLGV